MTKIENITLQKLAQNFSVYIAEDKKWKNEFSEKMEPLCKERDERIVLERAGKYFWKGLSAIVIFIGSVGVMIHYWPEILKTLHLK